MSISFGLGQHVDNVPADERIHTLFWKYLALNMYVVVSALVKVLIGLFLLRICSQQRWQRITIWTLLAVVIVFNIFYLFTVIFQCLPVQYYWYRYTNPQVMSGVCTKTKLATIPTYISLILNVIADWLLALLPVSFVCKAKMPFRTKCSVVAVLALGSMYVLSFEEIPVCTDSIQRIFGNNCTDSIRATDLAQRRLSVQLHKPGRMEHR